MGKKKTGQACVHAKTLIYDPRQSPRSNHNRRVAAQNYWTFDKDYHWYRDGNNFLIPEDGVARANPVDALR